MDAKGCDVFNVCIVFYRHPGDMRVQLCMPMDATNSTFVLCLHASRRYEGTRMDAKACYEFSVCIVFYRHPGDMRVQLCMPMDATNSTFVLCFTRFEVI